MRRLIVLGTTALALVSGSIAQAALPVVDFGAIAQMYQQLQSMAQQYAQLQQTYRAIAHLPANVTNQIGQQLNQFRNPLPSGATSGNMLNGNVVNSLAQQYLDRNHVYSSTGTDFQSTEMRRKAAGIAGATALAVSCSRLHRAGLAPCRRSNSSSPVRRMKRRCSISRRASRLNMPRCRQRRSKRNRWR